MFSPQHQRPALTRISDDGQSSRVIRPRKERRWLGEEVLHMESKCPLIYWVPFSTGKKVGFKNSTERKHKSIKRSLQLSLTMFYACTSPLK